jgi:hypothetical protein
MVRKSRLEPLEDPMNQLDLGAVGSLVNTTSDRRVKPRVICDYPVIIEGYDGEGNKYNENAKLANLSASGLFMMANRKVEYGSKISVIVLLTNALIDTDTPKLATKGIVVRTEPHMDGTCGIAIKFDHYRFL